jgi:hypothetical protein
MDNTPLLSWEKGMGDEAKTIKIKGYENEFSNNWFINNRYILLLKPKIDKRQNVGRPHLI